MNRTEREQMTSELTKTGKRRNIISEHMCCLFVCVSHLSVLCVFHLLSVCLSTCLSVSISLFCLFFFVCFICCWQFSSENFCLCSLCLHIICLSISKTHSVKSKLRDVAKDSIVTKPLTTTTSQHSKQRFSALSHTCLASSQLSSFCFRFSQSKSFFFFIVIIFFPFL